jgi:hypothetical protein
MADYIKSIDEPLSVKWALYDFAVDISSMSNKRFDSERFRVACGLTLRPEASGKEVA